MLITVTDLAAALIPCVTMTRKTSYCVPAFCITTAIIT